MTASLTTFNMSIRELDEMMRREVNMARRDEFKAKVRELQREYDAMKREYDGIRQQRLEYDRKLHREDLLTFRNPTGSERHPLVTEEALRQQEADVLSFGHRQVDAFLATGQEALEALRNQGVRFKSLQSKVAEIAGSLGVSRGVIAQIESRQGWNRIVFWTGTTLVIIVLLWILYRANS